MTQLPSVPTSNYQLSTPTDHKTVMRRQQTPPNVPIIELGATCRRDISWGRSDCSNTALSRLYRVSVARRHGGRTCLTGWKTWALMPFSFFFAFHQSSLPFMTMSCSFEHTTTLPIYYQTPPTPSSLGYMPPVYTSWTLGPILGPLHLNTSLLVAEYKSADTWSAHSGIPPCSSWATWLR